MIELRKHTMLEIPEMGWYDPDVVDARIAELEAQVPAVGSFAWALMQMAQGKRVTRSFKVLDGSWMSHECSDDIIGNMIGHHDIRSTDWEVTP